MTTPAQIAGVFGRLSSNDIIPRQYRCVRVRNRHASCRKCAGACTSGCISFEDGQIVVDHDKCVGCGTCCTVCPTCALEAARPNDAALLARAKRVLRACGDTVVFASEKTLHAAGGAADPEKVVEVVNLGRVEETLLVQLAVSGARRIVLVKGAAADETDLMGEATAALVCESTGAILAAWGSEASVGMVESLPAEVLQDGASSSAVNTDIPLAVEKEIPNTVTTDIPKDQVKSDFHRIKVMKDGTLPHFTPDRREALLDALYQLGEPPAQSVSARIWGHVVIDPDLCTGCRMCANFCPTGALFKYRDEDGSTGIEHSPGDCVRCMCCEDACRRGAISIEDEVSPADVLRGAVERYEMLPEELFRTNSHSIFNAVKKSFKTVRIFER